MSKNVKGFADKIAKSSKDFKTHCQVCGEALEFVKHIQPIADPQKKSLRFKEQMIGLCKCNRGQYLK